MQTQQMLQARDAPNRPSSISTSGIPSASALHTGRLSTSQHCSTSYTLLAPSHFHCTVSRINRSARPASTQTPEGSPKLVRYSPLHYNIEEFCKKVVPTAEERKVKDEVINIISGCCNKVFENVRGNRKISVETFGSYANGLATWNSDVDLVVVGAATPDRTTGGYEAGQKTEVVRHLRNITNNLRKTKKLKVKRVQVISGARMPIIKLDTHQNVSVDISVSDNAGPRAAKFLAQQCRSYPPMKPLVLVLKSLLKSQGLNDVASGGLSSYSLSNMVLVHLMEELKEGNDIFDLGEVLYSFLVRYGEEFSYRSDAVSVSSGGIVPKTALGYAVDFSRIDGGKGPYRLCVDCPLAGRDVSSGTFRIDDVQSVFVAAARSLEALAQQRSGVPVNYLLGLFGVEPSEVWQRKHSAPSRGRFFTVLPQTGTEDDDEFSDDDDF